MNRIILIGRLTADPELRYTNSGTAVATFSLAVDRPRPNQNGEREADFINIVVWQKLGELCAQYLKKGRQAAVDGRLQIRTYENKEGQKVRVAEVVAESVKFLDRADQGQTSMGGDYDRSSESYGSPRPSQPPMRKSNTFEDPIVSDGKPLDITDDDLPF